MLNELSASTLNSTDWPCLADTAELGSPWARHCSEATIITLNSGCSCAQCSRRSETQWFLLGQ